MGSVATEVRRLGGLAATYELHDAGWGRGALRTAVHAGDVIPVRQGWYASPDTDRRLVEAARVGGRLTCASGLELHGCWSLSDLDLHVRVPPTASRLRSPTNKRVRLVEGHPVRTHWRAGGVGSRFLLDPLECFADASGCLGDDDLAVLADSYLHRNPGALSTWAEDLRELGIGHPALVTADGICESGTETLFFRRMHRLRPRRQVVIPGIGRVDFLIGERLVVEVDGAEHHAGSTRFEADRQRDAQLSLRGFRVLRFSYWQVVSRWAEVEAAVWAAVARGDAY